MGFPDIELWQQPYNQCSQKILAYKVPPWYIVIIDHVIDHGIEFAIILTW